MINPKFTLAFFDNTDPDAAGWLMLFVWFVLFVFILNTIIFFLRRLFRRWRGRVGQAAPPTDKKGMT
jgi:threonine/homoserine/homoserine lactone efflux protein